MAASPAMEKLQNAVATSAIHDGERDEKDDYTGVCHPGTREVHLADLQAWADQAPPETRVEWVNAIAGAGKTAMLRTFCTLLEEQGRPPFSFFVWKGDAKRNTLKHFPATIAYQLCQTFPVLIPFIEEAVNRAPLLLQSAFKKQMDKLVIGPLLEACDTIKAECHHLIISVDGLDEFDAKGQTEFLDYIPYLLSRLSSLPISLLVSSRPDPKIVGAFNHPKLASITRATRLGASDADILKFLNDKFEDINLRHPHLRIEHGVDGKWPGDKKLEIMVKQSSGLFIWPTVAIGHIDKVEKGLGHNARLEQVLSSAAKPWVGSPLDNLYRAILEAHAPEDRTSYAFFRFKRCLALLCILDLGTFVRVSDDRVFDWSGAPVRAIFEETLDELWDSIAGLSSLFFSRKPLSNGQSPTPGISHRSLRDFTFNRERCGEEIYHSSEEELHAEIVCKFIKFFNTPQAYLSCAGMSAKFISRAGKFLQPHLKEAALSDELGCCMDDIVLDYIPRSWPLVTQMFAIAELFGGLYELAANPEFSRGQQRRVAMLSKVTAFVKIRSEHAQQWDTALFRLALSSTSFMAAFHNRSVYHWNLAQSFPQCTCRDTRMRNTAIRLARYQRGIHYSALFKDGRSRLVGDKEQNVAKDSLCVLQFFLSIPETSRRSSELPLFLPASSDYWIIDLLDHCPKNDGLYNVLWPLCMSAPLLDMENQEGKKSWELARQFLWQTEAFNRYRDRFQEPGIDMNFTLIKIPDNWWEDYTFRNGLLWFKHKPPFAIPDEWWQDMSTRCALLRQGSKPPFDIPDEWWQEKAAGYALFEQGLEPPSDILEEWWKDREDQQMLRSRGYPPPDSYHCDPDEEAEDERPAVQDIGTDQRVSQQDEQSADAEALSVITSSPLSTPVAALSNSLHVHPVRQAHPTTTPIVGAENGQVAPSNVAAGRRRRGIRDSLKNILRR